MKLRFALVLTTCLLSVGCSRDSHPAPRTSAPSDSLAPARAYDENAPPTRKEVLRALLASQDVSLSIDSSCSGVGTDPADSNIGDYISGFLAEQNDTKGKNWLDITAKRSSVPGVGSFWTCDVVIRHVDGEDRWGWGVSFQMRPKDHSVVKGSFRCTGSG